MDNNQNLRLEQKQILAPALQQSLKILSMSNQQLSEFIEQQQLENPVLECLFPEAPEDESVTNHTLFHVDYHSAGRKINTQSDFAHSDIPDEQPETLEDYLKEQLEITKLSKCEYHLALYMIEQIDERGYFCAALEEICAVTSATMQEAEHCLRIIQSMEPKGVGARDLAECLKLQLLSSGIGAPDILKVVSYHLDDVAHGHLNKIARELHITQSRVRELTATIRTLNPRPGSSFSEKKTLYIIPDVVIKKADAGFEISLNDKWIRIPVINNEYEAIAQSGENPELSDYINDKIHQARYILHSIEQRKKTIFSVMEIILHEQQDFFRGTGGLSPLGMKLVASRMGVHESTVCRVVKDKYVQCDRGTYPMRYFFVRELMGNSSGYTTTNLNAKEAILKFIHNEDSNFPLSDLDISERLKAVSISISRRTVAKYREEMGIKNAFLRKD